MSEATLNVEGFSAVGLARLDTMTREQFDDLPYGVIGMDEEFLVEVYNKAEARFAGLSVASIMGCHFFLSTAQCMNNFLVAQRFEDEAELDSIIDYVVTFRMRPTAVRLRLLQGSAARRRYILIEHSRSQM